MVTNSSIVEREDASGVKYKVQLIGNRTYPIYPSWEDRDYGEFLTMVKKMEVRSDDLFVCGYPKSGNNWVYEVISMIAQQSPDLVKNRMNAEQLDSKPDLKPFETMESSRRMYTHLNPDSLPEQIPEKGAKVIYLVRNVKDVAVSTYHFVNILTQMVVYKGEWKDFIDIALGEGMVYGSWFDHVEQAELYQKQNPNVPFYVLCYETLKMDPKSEIEKLCQFLNVPSHLAEEIATKTSFKSMRPKVMAGKFKDVDFMEKGSVGLFRKGVVGDWKTMFTVDQNERVDQLLEKKLGQSSIVKRLQPFMQ